jgi:hypothetical protein
MGGASPVPPQDPNAGGQPMPDDGGEFDDGEDMGGEMPDAGQGAPMDGPEDMGGMEEPMGDASNDPKFQQLQQAWGNLSPDQQEATIKYAESMGKESGSEIAGQPPMDAPQAPMDMSQEPMQERVVFKKKQLEEIMKRK